MCNNLFSCKNKILIGTQKDRRTEGEEAEIQTKREREQQREKERVSERERSRDRVREACTHFR